MAQLSGILSKLTGSAGQLTFKRLNGKTIVSEKITQTTNKRTAAQQKHRMKWPNIINMYSGISPLLNDAFELKADGLSDYNAFVKKNFAGSTVYLTKQETAAKACVAAPYQISDGSLDSIALTGDAGASVTDIALGSFSISASTTVKEFSNAVVQDNSDYNYGDQIAFIRVIQQTDAINGYPVCKFVGECIVLDKKSDEILRNCVSEAGFSVTDGKLGCSLSTSFQGAYAWIHSRKSSGITNISSQVLVVKNDIYTQYSDEAAYQRAVATYGGEKTSFLSPDSNTEASTVTDDEDDSTPTTTKYTLSLSANPTNGGTVTGAGSYDAGTSVNISAAPASGYTFSKWSDEDTNASRSIVMNADSNLTAIFTANSTPNPGESEGGENEDEDGGGSI